jgi:hypothetical protein
MVWRLAGLAVVGAVFAAVWVVEDFRGRSALQTFLDEAKAAGEPLTIEALRGPAIRDDENAAAAEPLAQVVKSPASPETKALLELLELPKNAVPLLATNDGKGMLGFWVLALHDANDKASRGSTSAPPKYPVPRYLDKPGADLLAGLSRMQPALDALAAAALRPQVGFQVKADPLAPDGARHIELLGEAVESMALRSLARLDDGDTRGAFTDAKSTLLIADLMRGDARAVAQRRRLGADAKSLEPLWAGVLSHVWRDAELAEFQSILGRRRFFDGFVTAALFDRAWLYAAFEHFVKTPGDITEIDRSELMDDSGRLMNFGPFLVKALARGPEGWVRQNEVHALRYASQAVAIGRVLAANSAPDRLAFALLTQTDLTNDVHEAAIYRPGLYNVVSGMLGSTTGPVLRRFAQAHALNQMALTVCALERQRLARGRYPETLDEIEKRLLVVPPVDPVDGKPMRYRRNTDDTFTLYCIGFDGRDDGGVYARARGDEPLDWPWPPFTPDADPRMF